MMKNMHHGGVYCHDIDETIRWYEGLGFRVLFRTNAMEGDKPLKMAWIKAGADVVLELLEQEDKSTVDAAGQTQNHIAVRVDDIEAFAALLREKGIAIEAGPFATTLEFDRPLTDEDAATFEQFGEAGLNLKIMFFRGINGERFEVVQDNLGAL
ncbi:MAG TPA: VOC family protein [Candidatus Aphodovivens avistercoris]|nr:VOC family protein [Candidatus Aphodovivens avistercoris]